MRAAFRGLFEHCEAANTRHITYDCVEQEFVAGSWMYDENLIAFLAFLTLVRGAEDALGPDGTGVAVIHDYGFSPAEAEATAATFVKNGRPTRLFRLKTVDERTMGALMMHFMLETMFAAELWGVDAFDQPAVEEAKVLTREYLSASGTP